MKKIHIASAAIAVIVGVLSSTVLAQTGGTAKSEALSAAIARLEDRIHQLEQVRDMSATVSKNAGGSVGLIVGEYIWTDLSGRKPLRYEEGGKNSSPKQDADGRDVVSFDGDGQIVIREFQGTGFLVDSTHLLTSAFILAPWASDPLLDTTENPRLIPLIRTLHVYLPGVLKPIDLKIDRTAESGDAVICVLHDSLADRGIAISSEEIPANEPVVLLGYPGGVDMLTSRVPDDIRRELYKYGQPRLDETAQMLAARGYITPIAMQSRISGQAENRVFFETFATYGSTGGPILNAKGQVIAMNESVYPAYPSFNMALAIAPMKSWITPAPWWSIRHEFE